MPSAFHAPPVCVWLKRDLRIADHEPLGEAVLKARGAGVLAVFLYEPELLDQPEWSSAHTAFQAECLRTLEPQLARCGVRLVTRRGEAVAALEQLRQEQGFSSSSLTRKQGPPSPTREIDGCGPGRGHAAWSFGNGRRPESCVGCENATAGTDVGKNAWKRRCPRPCQRVHSRHRWQSCRAVECLGPLTLGSRLIAQLVSREARRPRWRHSTVFSRSGAGPTQAASAVRSLQ